MGEKNKIKIIVFICYLLILNACETRILNEGLTSIPRRTIAKELKKNATSADSIFVIDLQNLFTEKVDSVFYFNGPLFSSQISETTGLAVREWGCTRTLQDTQSRIILFGGGRVMYYETFRIGFCLMDSQKTESAKYNTIIDVFRYSMNAFKMVPR